MFFLDRTGIPATHNIPRPSFPHHWIEYDHTSPEETFERAKDADIVITSKVVFDRELLSRLPKLKLIAILPPAPTTFDLDAAKA